MELTTHDFLVRLHYDEDDKFVTICEDDQQIMRYMTDVIINEVYGNQRDILVVNGIYPYTLALRDRVCSILDAGARFPGQKGMCIKRPHGQGSATFVTYEELQRFPHWANTGSTLVIWGDEPYEWTVGDITKSCPQKRVIAFSYDPTTVFDDSLTSLDLTSTPAELIESYNPNTKYNSGDDGDTPYF